MKKIFYLLLISFLSIYCFGQNPQAKKQNNKPPIQIPVNPPPYNPIPDNLFFLVKGVTVELPKNITWDQFVRQAIIEGGCIQQFPPRWKGFNGIAYRQPRKIKDLNGNTREVDCTYPHNLQIWPPDYGNQDEPDQYGKFELAKLKNPINTKNWGKTIYIENDILIAGKLDNKNQYNKDGTRNAFKIKLFEFNKQNLIAETVTDKSNTYCFWSNPLNIKNYPKSVWIQVIPIVVKDIGEDIPPVIEKEYLGCMETFPIDHTYLSTVPEDEAELCVRNSTMRITITKSIIKEINSGRDMIVLLNRPLREKINKVETKTILPKIDFDFYNILENENTTYKFDNKSRQTVITTPIKLKGGTVNLIVTGELTSYKLFDPQNPNKQQRTKEVQEWDWTKGTVFDPFGPIPSQK